MPPKKGTSEPKTFAVGDLVLAALKGYPPWPAQIVDGDSVAPRVKRERPRAGKTYCVQFFPAGDYSWLGAKALNPLSQREVEAYVSEPSKKHGDLLDAYKTAKDPTEWREMIASREREAEEARQAKAALSMEDQLADDDDELDDAASGSKKRKRKSDAAPKDAGEEKKRKKARLQALADKSKGDTTEDESKKKADDEENDPGFMKVKEWRKRLQGIFLGKSAPNEEGISKAQEYFDDMEKSETKIDWLAKTKLPKVLKHIAALGDEQIPREADLGFRKRATALAQKWAALVPEGIAEGSPAPPKSAEEIKSEDTEMKTEEPEAEESKSKAPKVEESKPEESKEEPSAVELKVEPKAEEPTSAPVATGQPAAEAPPAPAGAAVSETAPAPAMTNGSATTEPKDESTPAGSATTTATEPQKSELSAPSEAAPVSTEVNATVPAKMDVPAGSETAPAA